jgi:uncharacterized membrane protein YedE/YeeE
MNPTASDLASLNINILQFLAFTYLFDERPIKTGFQLFFLLFFAALFVIYTLSLLILACALIAKGLKAQDAPKT